MSAIKDLAYDIEQLYIDGYSAKQIAIQLNCPIKQVLGFLESINVADTPQEDISPYDTINS
jgi:DNA-binding CsgD family transcriptional regulator